MAMPLHETTYSAGMGVVRSADVSPDDVEKMACLAESLPEGSPIAVLLHGVLSSMARGEDVAYLTHDSELTPNQAAELLNVSRPHLVKLMDRGLLEYRMVGSNRRVAVADLMDFIERHERANAHVNTLLGSQIQHTRELRESMVGLSERDTAELDNLVF
ncbi:MAG: helix-turn-helix domain-containing protein [Ancrocorticia sp.]|jgi:excisionase family DNA binding protein|nr:helix-turn-helix domain-containing protein [Ancrocorticia sp.]